MTQGEAELPRTFDSSVRTIIGRAGAIATHAIDLWPKEV